MIMHLGKSFLEFLRFSLPLLIFTAAADHPHNADGSGSSGHGEPIRDGVPYTNMKFFALLSLFSLLIYADVVVQVTQQGEEEVDDDFFFSFFLLLTTKLLFSLLML